MTTVEALERRARGLNPAQCRAGVKAYLSFMPIFRRLKAVYRLRDISIQLLVIMAHRGDMTPTRLCIECYGDKDTNKYRYTRAALTTMRANGLVGNVGGKWHLTEKGMRELGLID